MRARTHTLKQTPTFDCYFTNNMTCSSKYTDNLLLIGAVKTYIITYGIDKDHKAEDYKLYNQDKLGPLFYSLSVCLSLSVSLCPSL